MQGVLIDENLPRRLTEVLKVAGIKALHTSELDLNGRPDAEVLARALADNLAVMTKDSDYIDLALTTGKGKVVLISAGNLRLGALILYVGERASAIREFLLSPEKVASL
jgi:predicted nuclease of predicted toxin-antitoxin system